MAPLKRLIIPGLIALSIPAAYRFYRTDDNPFYVDCRPGVKRWTQSVINNTPVPGHEWRAKNTADGLHLRLYMAGVGKDNVKVWVDGADLIAEGMKEKDFEDDDEGATLMRYRVMSPPEKLFDLEAMQADINNGMLKVFVPRRTED